jgi:pyruvate/2-oxoglutarate dehydrogenase complex dihydrolipoamide dehydrogenase (E3) component
VIVLGGGPAGENAAQHAIKGSERTAVIVEDALLGGECSYWACIPSKAVLRPVEVLDCARALPGVAGALTGSLDVDAVLARRDDFTHHHDDGGQVEWARQAGIDVVRGRGRLAGEKKAEVTASDGSDRALRARQAVVVATGSTASVPPVPGLREARPWTSRDVTNLREVPRRVAVIGGGVVAGESATWLWGLGAREITLIQRSSSLLAGLEPFSVASSPTGSRASGSGCCSTPRCSPSGARRRRTPVSGGSMAAQPRFPPADRRSRSMRSSWLPGAPPPPLTSGWTGSGWTWAARTASSLPTTTCR